MQNAFSPDNPLVLIGCGNMGQAMAEGWLRSGVPAAAFFVIDPIASPASFPALPESQFFKNINDMPDGVKAKVLILAVKPQIMDAVLPTIAPITVPHTLVVSVAAGVTTARLAEGAGCEARFVRSMPNTPAAVGAGITGVTALGLSDEEKALVLSLLEATGKAIWVEKESLIDAVTGVSGSGPAYVFHMVEAMAAAGVAEGLDPETAMALARQTVIGAGQLMAADESISATVLRERVTSPGGTTAAALSVLMGDEALSKLMAKAIKAAANRGKELSA